LVYADPEEFFYQPNAKQQIFLRKDRPASDARRELEQLDAVALIAERAGHNRPLAPLAIHHSPTAGLIT